MMRTQQSVTLAVLLAALALAGCGATPSSVNNDQLGSASTTMGSSATAGAIGSSNTSGATAGNMDVQNTEGGSAAQAPGAFGANKPQGMMTANAVVITVESMPRQNAAVAAGAALGGTGSVGSTGSSMGEDKMYRITLRMDDGSTRVITQETSPGFGAGDRVNMTDGAISNTR